MKRCQYYNAWDLDGGTRRISCRGLLRKAAAHLRKGTSGIFALIGVVAGVATLMSATGLSQSGWRESLELSSVAKTCEEIEEEINQKHGKVASMVLLDLKEAHEHLGAKDFRKAARIYSNLLRSFPDLASLHFNLGYSYYHLEEYDAMVAQYECFIELNDEANREGVTADSTAMRMLNKALEMRLTDKKLEQQNNDKETALLHSYLGLLGGRSSEWDKAIRHYREALRIFEETGDKTSTAGIYANIGAIYQQRGDWTHAESAYDRSLTIIQDLASEELPKSSSVSLSGGSVNTCGYCGLRFAANLYAIVNAQTDPDLGELVMTGEINLKKCPFCQSEDYVLAPFLYHNPQRKQLFFYFPKQYADHEDKTRELANDYMTEYKARLTRDQVSKLDVLQLRYFSHLVTLFKAALFGEGEQRHTCNVLTLADGTKMLIDVSRNIMIKFPRYLDDRPFSDVQIRSMIVLHRGIDCLEKGNLSLAEQYLMESIHLWPTNDLGYYTLGILYYGLGNLKKAEKLFSIAQKAKSKH